MKEKDSIGMRIAQVVFVLTGIGAAIGIVTALFDPFSLMKQEDEPVPADVIATRAKVKEHVPFDEMHFNRCVPEPTGGAYLFNDVKSGEISSLLATYGPKGIWFVRNGIAKKIFDEAKITRCVPTPDGGAYLFNDDGTPGVWFMKAGKVVRVAEAPPLDKQGSKNSKTTYVTIDGKRIAVTEH